MSTQRQLKLTFFGSDLSLYVLDYLSTIHKVVSVQTYVGEKSCRLIQFANARGIAVSTTKPDPNDIDDLARSADLYVCYGYPFKIPIPPELKYGLNIHFAFLPQMRGPRPIPWILLDHHDAAGVTIHKLVQDYDAGDILLRERLHLAQDETYSSYAVKGCLLAGRMVRRLFSNFYNMWDKAQEQDELAATWAGSPTRKERTITTGDTVVEAARRISAFGPLGTYLRVDQRCYKIFSITNCRHDEKLHLPNGERCIAYAPNILAVQLADGYIVCDSFSLDKPSNP
jgi:methionyl-tRNA formyltransferase